jgi:hypothetical protein
MSHSYAIILDDSSLANAGLSGNVKISARDSVLYKCNFDNSILDIELFEGNQYLDFLRCEFYNVASSTMFQEGISYTRCQFHIVDIDPNVDYSSLCNNCLFILDKGQEFVFNWDINWGRTNRVVDQFGIARR